MKNAIIFSGTGGQGIVSMGKMLADAAIESGKHALDYPSYGAEQRGGIAKSVVIIDDKEIVSPMAQKGGVLVAMTQNAYNTFINDLEPGGTLVYDSAMITKPIERTDIKKVAIPAGDLAIQIGSPRVANVIIIGALVFIGGYVTLDQIKDSLNTKFADKSETVRKLNEVALDKGFEIAKNLNK